MQADLFKCSFCSEFYDLELHLPKVLISCSHCLCLECLKITFTLYSPQRRKCPICDIGFPSKINSPEDFLTDKTLLQLLPPQPQAKLAAGMEFTRKQASNVRHKNVCEELFPDRIRKKQKTEQHIDELITLQEPITNQVIRVKKRLPQNQAGTSQNFETEAWQDTSNQKGTTPETFHNGPEFLIKEESDDHKDESPLAEFTIKKPKGIFIETQETLNRMLKTRNSLTNQVLTPTQPIPQDSSSVPSKEEEEQIETKMEVSTLSKVNSDDALKSEVTTKITGNGEKMEEEFDNKEEERSLSAESERKKLLEDEIQHMKHQIMEMEVASLLKLDFSDKDLSDTIFTYLCSEDFWSGIDKNKALYFEVLEVNFSASSLTDQQFTKFVQNIMSHLQNLTSIMINFAQTRISSESLQALSEQCLKYHKLQSFGLNCSQTSIGDEGFESLDNGLNHSLETLENIELIFDSTDVEGEEFLDSLLGMDHLKNLKLSFENAIVSSEIVTAVISCLGVVGKNLESLELNFNGTEIDDESLEKFCTDVIPQMERLKHFKLYLGGTLISSNFLLDFSQSLRSIAPHLETLELNLHDTEFDNRAFKYFCDGALSKMQNIESLKLDLSRTKITDTSLKNLLLPANKLRSLFVNLSENKIHDSGLKIFKENNNFQNIKSINLNVGQTDVTDEALQDFLNHVEKGSVTQILSPRHEASSDNSIDPENHSDKEPNPKNEISIAKELDLKRKVLLELKKRLAAYYGSKSEPSELSSLQVSKYINKLESKAYDNILTQTLTKTLPSSKITTKEVETWKKLIQQVIKSSLIKNSNKFKKIIGKKHITSNIRRKVNSHKTEAKQNKISTEGKSNNAYDSHSSQISSQNDPDMKPSEFVLSFRWFKRYAQEISFRKKVIEILKSMETRTFFVFYQRLLDFLLRLSKTYKTWQLPAKLDDLTYSYNWWSRFIRKDQEIANLWKKLPWTRE